MMSQHSLAITTDKLISIRRTMWYTECHNSFQNGELKFWKNNLPGTQSDIWKNKGDTSKEFGNYFSSENEQNCEL